MSSIFNRLFSQKGKTKSNPARIEQNHYLEMREMALKIKSEEIGVSLENDKQVYGAIIDMPIGKHIATLICMADNTTSLYFNNGGGIIGLGQHQSIENVTKLFLDGANQIDNQFEMTNSFELPTKNYHNVFLLTNSGVYGTSINPDRVNTISEKEYFLLCLYQNVLTEIQRVTNKEDYSL